MLLTTAEDSPFTARRFGSREDPDSAPQLEIEFTSPLRLILPQAQNNGFSFQFDPVAGNAYVVEYIARLGDPTVHWQTLTNFIAQTSERATINDSISEGSRFYRVREP